MKGLEMNIVNLVILAIALTILSIVIMRLLPAFGTLISTSLKGMKASLCQMIGPAGWLLGC